MKEQQQLDRMFDHIRDNLLELAYEYQSVSNEQLPDNEHYTIAQCLEVVTDNLKCAITSELDFESDDEQ